MTSRTRLALAALLPWLAAGQAFAQPPLPPQPAPSTSASPATPADTSQDAQPPARTRAEAIAAEQAAKARALTPEGPTRVEKAVVRVMSSPLLAGTGGPYPWFGSVFGGSGFAAGAGYLKRLPHNTQFGGIAGISINGSTLLEATLNGPSGRGSRLQPRFLARKQDVNDVSFFGIGQDSSKEHSTDYDYAPTALGAGLALKPVRFVEITAGYEWLGIDTDLAGVLQAGFQPADVPGLGEPYSFDVLRTGATFDTRPSPAYATHGTLGRVAFNRYAARDDARFSFDEVEVEAAQLVPLLRNQYVLAFRALGTFTSADGDNRVPVPLMPYLGSGSTLRGFPNRRFYDTNRMLVTGEYRWLPSRYVDMALFLDAGQVAPRTDAFRLSDFDTSWGIGLRVHGPAFSAFRIDLARSREAWNLVFAASQPF